MLKFYLTLRSDDSFSMTCLQGTPYSAKVLPDPGIKLGSPALQADSLPAELPGKPHICVSVQLLSRVWLFVTPWTAHARLPGPSPTPGACSNSRPLSRWYHPSHPLSSPSPPAFNLSQHQGLFQWVSSSHQVAKVLEFQLQHQSF